MNVKFAIGKDRFATRAMAVPGKQISWTAALSVDPINRDILDKMHYHISRTRQLPEADTHYLPPRVKEGKFCGVVLVNEGEVEDVAETITKVVVEPETHSEGSKAHDNSTEDEEKDVGKYEKILEEWVDGSLGVVEAEGDMQGGSADIGDDDVTSVKSIVTKEPVTKLVTATKADPTLAELGH